MRIRILLNIYIACCSLCAVAQPFQLAPPQIRYQTPFFEKNTTATCVFALEGAAIHYTLDGTTPTHASPRYRRPVRIQKSAVLKAIAFHPDYLDSEVSSASFVRVAAIPAAQIAFDMPPSPQYPGHGAATLTDHQKGGLDVHDGKWLGFEGTQAGVTMHFDKPFQPASLTLSALVSTGSWIFPPRSVEVLGSLDGSAYFPVGHRQFDAGGDSAHPTDGQNFYTLPLEPKMIRHIKVVVHPYGNLPAWHPGAGKPAWLFLDEIIVE
jgi:hexosaminidase